MNFEEMSKTVKDMMALFEDIDRQTQSFASQTGLKCKSGCGACCLNPEIETTVAEVLPLAVHLWEDPSHAESVLEAIQLKNAKGACIFYKPDPLVPTHGRCSIYTYRPGLCRLFGFAARKNKYGQAEMVTCKVIKDSQAKACQDTQEKLNQGLEAPLLGDHALRVSHIDPVNGRELVALNKAIGLALEKVGYAKLNWQHEKK